MINKKQQEKQVDAGVVATAIEAVIAANAKAIEDYKKGNSKALHFLIGQVLKEAKDKADAKFVLILSGVVLLLVGSVLSFFINKK